MMILMKNYEKADSEVSNTTSLDYTKGALIYHLHGMCALKDSKRIFNNNL